MGKKAKPLAPGGGAVGLSGPSLKEARKHAMERYKNDYGFKRGVRVSSPDRDPYSYGHMVEMANVNDHWYGLRDRREIKLVTGEKHEFKGARSANNGHSVYGTKKSGSGDKVLSGSRKGHLIGKR